MTTTTATRAWPVLALAVAACSSAAPASSPAPIAVAARSAPPPSEELSPRVMRRYRPLPPPPAVAPAVAALGRMLYYDPRLSASGTVACNTCHPLADYGATHDVVSTGVDGQHGTRNAPTTYHAAGHFRQFWDGRSATIEDQAKAPIINPREMGMSPGAVVTTLASIPGYPELFARAFPDRGEPLSFDTVAIAIGAFERGLSTPGRWDRYLAGDTTALTPREKTGAKLFANAGCVVCHTGAYVGGAMFAKAGAKVPWPSATDRGRIQVTGVETDDMMFKVPSLRDVARTAPYFHDGSAATLDQAVRMMARHQLELELTDDEVGAIVAWLEVLTGELPAAYIARPALPDDPGESS